MEIQPPQYLSLEEHYAVYRPVGEFTFNEAVTMIDEALAYCCRTENAALLVDITGITGFPPPTPAERFAFATKWAGTAGGKVILSVVSPPELIDPEKIGVTMGHNRGLNSNVFTSESEATAWLLRESARSVGSL